MAIRRHQRTLNLWANGILVGQWRLAPDGTDELVYDSQWVKAPHARPLSLSLPFPSNNLPLRGAKVGNFFENLLPDSDAIKRRIQTRFRIVNTQAFNLLTAIGRDCAGAIQLLPEGQTPHNVFTIQAQALSEAEVANLLRATASAPSAYDAAGLLDDDFRISIAGAQEKTALLWHEGKWCRPLGATPTTHIFKLPLGLVGNRQANMRTSVENEWLCSQILRHFSLPVASCEIGQFEDQKALIVERFDRRRSTDGYWLRIPQEDFCQATGTPPGAKYEVDGGPRVIDIASVLRTSENAQEDLTTLLKAQLLFWLMAATDGHAKNFSIFLLPGGRHRLTPLYDVLSVWPVTGRGPNQLDENRLRLAMSVRGKNKHYRLRDIQRRHFNHMARACGFGKNMENIIAEVLHDLPRVFSSAESILPTGFPEDVFVAIKSGMQRSAIRLSNMPAE